MIARIAVTKINFGQQKEVIREAIKSIN